MPELLITETIDILIKIKSPQPEESKYYKRTKYRGDPFSWLQVFEVSKDNTICMFLFFQVFLFIKEIVPAI